MPRSLHPCEIESKHLRDLFSDPKSKFFDPHCKPKINIRERKEKNKKKAVARNRVSEWKGENPDKAGEQVMRWRDKHREKYNDYQRRLMAKRRAA